MVYLLKKKDKVLRAYSDKDVAEEEARKKNAERVSNGEWFTNAFYYVEPVELVG